jgi:type IV pilus assembly protein PilY1
VGIKALSDPAFVANHQYFVDGEIAISSVSQLDNKNYLVSTLGRGGKGLFGLDVTSPSTFSSSNVLWEYFPTNDPDLGNMLGKPVIAQLDSGAWVAIVGNGYNSTSGKAALYIFNLKTGALIRKIDTGFAGDNGLATPGLYDADGDGKIDTAYGGDLFGNVWKFDLSNKTDASQWKVALGGLPLFRAKDANGNYQPITSEITVTRNTVPSDDNFGARYVHFGTGSYFRTTDPTSTAVQSWYGLIDADTAITSRVNMVARTVSVAQTFGGKSGFYIDLPASGERIVTATRVFVRNQPVLIGSTNIPKDDECTPGGTGYINAINPFTGARLSKPFFDINDNGNFLDDTINGAYIGSFDLNIGTPTENLFVGNFLITGGSSGLGGKKTLPPATPIRGRLTWREIVRD